MKWRCQSGMIGIACCFALELAQAADGTNPKTNPGEKKSGKAVVKDSSDGSEREEKPKKAVKPSKPKLPVIEKVAPPVPLDYGKDPKPPRRLSTEELLDGPEAGLVTVQSQMALGVQIMRNPGLNLHLPAVLSGATTLGFGVGPFSIYADQQYHFRLNFSPALLPDIASFHQLRGQFLWTLGGGIEGGRAFAGRGLFGGQFTFSKMPAQLYGNALLLYYVGNAEIAGGLTYGLSLGGRILL
jgi:hypothetical protein